MQGFKICQLKSSPPVRAGEMEHHFYINAECVCQATENKKQEMEKLLKTQSCAKGITIKVLEETNNEGKC